jgi:hypothetical protein
MATLGTVTRYVIVIGILAFIVLACIPNMRSYAIAATLITPIVAAGIAGLELMYHKKANAGFAMIAAVALVVCALLFGVAV